jgi:hypothetical protein
MMASDSSGKGIGQFWNTGAPPRHAAGEVNHKKYMTTLFLKNLGLLVLGAALGYGFYYFFSSQSAFIIERFKVLQSFFGINQYNPGMTVTRVITTILLGNLISVLCYIGLGFGRLSLPVSFISGFFISVFLFSGIIRHDTQIIPIEVIILTVVEMLYRVLAVSTGEYLGKHKLQSKIVPWVSLGIILIMYLAAAMYEIWQIF